MIFRSFVRFFAEEQDASRRSYEKRNSDTDPKSKGVSKEVGEYIDYEEIKD